MQPKLCVVCLGLDVAAGLGFTAGWTLQGFKICSGVGL